MANTIKTFNNYDINDINSIYDFIVALYLYLDDDNLSKAKKEYKGYLNLEINIKINNNLHNIIDTLFLYCNNNEDCSISIEKDVFEKFKCKWSDLLKQSIDFVPSFCYQTLICFDNFLGKKDKYFHSEILTIQEPFNSITRDKALFYNSAPKKYNEDIMKKYHIRLARQIAVGNPNSLNLYFNNFQIIKLTDLKEFSIKIHKYNKLFDNKKGINIGLYSTNVFTYSNIIYDDNNFTIHTKYKDNHEQAFVDNFLTVLKDLDNDNINIALFPEMSLLPNSLKSICQQLPYLNLKNIELIFTGSEWIDNANRAYVISTNGTVLLTHHKYIKYSEYRNNEIFPYEEDIKKNTNIELLDIEGLGRIGYMICRDCTGEDFNNMFVSTMGANILFISAYTSQSSLMISYADSNAKVQAVTSIMCNTCNKNKENKVLGYIFKPIFHANKTITISKKIFNRECLECCKNTVCKDCNNICINKYDLNIEN